MIQAKRNLLPNTRAFVLMGKEEVECTVLHLSSLPLMLPAELAFDSRGFLQRRFANKNTIQFAILRPKRPIRPIEEARRIPLERRTMTSLRGESLSLSSSPLALFSLALFSHLADIMPVSLVLTDDLALCNKETLPGAEGGVCFNARKGEPTKAESIVGLLSLPVLLKERIVGLSVLVHARMLLAWAVQATGLSTDGASWCLLCHDNMALERYRAIRPLVSPFGRSSLQKIVVAVDNEKPPNEVQIAAIRNADKYTVCVQVRGQWGSGILLSKHGIVLTNAHVVASPKREGADKNAKPPDKEKAFERAISEIEDIRVRLDHVNFTGASTIRSVEFHPAQVIFVSSSYVSALVWLAACEGGRSETCASGI